MSKSYVEVLQGLFSAIFADCIEAFPNDRKGLERDLSRLLSLLQSRGLGFVTLDLPAIGKDFDRSLSSGLLSLSSAPGFGRTVQGGTVPVFLSTLFLKVFEGSGVLLDDPDTTSIFFIRQLLYAAKKLKVDCDGKRTSDAVREFFRIEDELRSPTLLWDDDFLDCRDRDSLSFDSACLAHGQGAQSKCGLESNSDLFSEERCAYRIQSILVTVQRVADIVSSSLGWFDPFEWDQKHGPGAVSDLRQRESKYGFPHWPDKLETIFPSADFAFANYGIWVNSIQEFIGAGSGLSRHEPPSKLLAVPKTQKGPRLIASEPTSHQFGQQSVNAFLRSRISETAIAESVCFSSQDPNKRLALKASASGSHATIDLSSASDRMSLWVVERIFRANFRLLEAIHSCRTRWLVNNIDKTLPTFIKLKKVAAQGAAFTFPLQTILYSIVSVGCGLHSLGLPVTTENIRRVARETRVFGDDIIVPIDIFGDVASVLQALGFEVNHGKSFGTGKFRESCGCDAYSGVDVTPAYYLRTYDKSRPVSITSVVEQANNFYKKGLVRTRDWIISTLPSDLREKIPLVSMESGAFGLTDAGGLNIGSLETRYNKYNQQLEVRCLGVTTSSPRIPDHWNSSLLQYFIEAPPASQFVKWSSGVNSKPKVRLGLRWVPLSELA